MVRHAHSEASGVRMLLLKKMVIYFILRAKFIDAQYDLLTFYATFVIVLLHSSRLACHY